MPRFRETPPNFITPFFNRFDCRLNSLLFAAGISLLILGLFYNWFAVADRYHIFLYEHLGAGAFHPRTVSRYWMAGLVADGFVLLGYALFNWFAGRIWGVFNRKYIPPKWHCVWFATFLPVAIGIVWITTTVNHPTLPLPITLMCVTATVVALIPALMGGTVFAQNTARALAWGLSGAGLIPVFLLIKTVELPAKGLIDLQTAYATALGGTLLGALWVFISAWTLRRKVGIEAGWQIFIAGIAWSYLLLPMIHYLVLTPVAYRYISVSDNFFALHGGVQMISWFVPALLVWLIQPRRTK